MRGELTTIIRRRPISSVFVALSLATFAVAPSFADTLAVFEHHIVGARLRASPSPVFVPKGIPGSILVELTTADGRPHPEAAALAHGKHIEGVLRGPGFPAQRFLGLPNEPIGLPVFALAGDYQIDELRLVDTNTSETRAMADPSSIEVHVFPDLLVSQVVSRPLTYDEIKDRGIEIDPTSFSGYEFEAALQVGGRRIALKFPVISPKFRGAIELLSDAERNARLVEAERINRRIAASIELPRQLRLPGFNIQMRGVNFEPVGSGEEELARRGAGYIPALVVIPGSVGFLNQFFGVQIYTANAAPNESGISVHDVVAELVPPLGRDHIAGTEDDPIVPARVGPNAHPNLTSPVRGLGQDGRAGTEDDATRLGPGETGQGELLVEAKREGLHEFGIKLHATLDGLAAGEVAVEGLATGSVLVRNPKFAISFSHPRTVRSGEPYTAAMTVLNTSETPANLVSVNLTRASLSGVELEEGQAEQVEIGNLAPGQSSTAEFRLIARATGDVFFTNLSGDDGLSGRFDLKMGVDERGVALSSEMIGYPDWVTLLPEGVRRTADRVLGQALSAATAAVLPPGVRRPDVDTVRARVIELVEAGQRLGHGDVTERVLVDLLLDWYGGRTQSLAFDQILRETNAGAAFRDAMAAELSAVTDDSGLALIDRLARDVAGRSEPWGFAATGGPSTSVSVRAGGVSTDLLRADAIESGAFSGMNGSIAIMRGPEVRTGLEVTFRVPPGGSAESAAWITTDANGHGSRVTFTASSDPNVATCYRYLPLASPSVVTIDLGCEQRSTGQVAVSASSFEELPPEILAVDQDLSVIAERPQLYCYGPFFEYFGRQRTYDNYGTLALVLFSKPMPPELLEQQGAFFLDNGVTTTGVKTQPGGRVALLNFRKAFGTLKPRSLRAAAFVADARGHALMSATHAIDLAADQGVSISGKVVAATGEAVPNVPVTLTMHDFKGGAHCQPFDIRSSQVLSDAEGRFNFEFVMAGLSYSVSATDIRGLSADAQALLREAAPTGEIDPDEIAQLISRDGAPEIWFDGQRLTEDQNSVLLAQSVDRAVFRDLVPLESPRIGSEVPVALRFRGRGTVFGRVLASDGTTIVTGAAVNLFPSSSSGELGRGMLSDGAGGFEFAGVPLGEVSIRVATNDGLSRSVSARLQTPGERLEVDVVLSASATAQGAIAGTVYDADGVTPHPRADVSLTVGPAVFDRVIADGDGRYAFRDVPEGDYSLVALSSDGRRATPFRRAHCFPNLTTNIYLTLPGTGLVAGRVEYSNGQPVAGALVAGGETVVTTNAQGEFTLSGVPAGRRTILAALDVDLARGIEFVRTGRTFVDVLPGIVSYGVVRLSTAGRIRGRVFDAAGLPIPSIRVAIPQPEGFLWAQADVTGRFSFSPLALAKYTLTAPSPPVAEDSTITDQIEDALADRSEADLGAALTGLIDSFVSGPAESSRPAGFGGTQAELTFDGQTEVADIHFLPEGEISGRVLNHLGVPIAADVTLSALTQTDRGALTVGVIGLMRSDAATGEFRFTGVEIGPYSVVAQSPFYPRSVKVGGLTSLVSQNAQNLVLRFPPTEATGARVTGRVLRDGAPVGAGVRVGISFGTNYEIQTIADGSFDTQVDIPAGNYSVTAYDPSTGRRGKKGVQVVAGRPALVEVSLLSHAGGLDVLVLDAQDAPVSAAAVTLQFAGSASESYDETTNASGLASFSTLTEGFYSAVACRVVAQTRICKSGTISVPASGRASLTLRLGGTGTIAGMYVESNGTTPVTFAQVSAGPVGHAPIAIGTTDAQGRYELLGIPIGRHEVIARNPVTDRGARVVVQISTDGQVVQALLREDELGEVIGGVIDSNGRDFVAAAPVTMKPSNPIFEERAVTTDPSGQFNFPGVPPGGFQLVAESGSRTDPRRGTALGTMPTPPVTLRVDVPLERRGSIVVYVRDTDGSAEEATVHITGPGPRSVVDTDQGGRASFSNLRLGRYTISAASRALAQTRSVADQRIELTALSATATVTLTLRGVGIVEGTVLTAEDAPVSGAEVKIKVADSEAITDIEDTALSGSDGRFSFSNVPVGLFQVRAIFGALDGRVNGTITQAGQTKNVIVTLTPASDLTGRLFRADGFTPVTGEDVFIEYSATSGLTSAAVTKTSSTGRFSFGGIPVGAYVLRSDVPRHDGVLLYRGEVASSGSLIDIGAVLLDEDRPAVVSSFPADGATNFPVDVDLRVTFSEAMEHDLPDNQSAFLVRLRGSDLPLFIGTDFAWETVGGETRTLVVHPREPLLSETSYALVVLGPVQLLENQRTAGPGPLDLAERPMDAPFTAQFTTRDSIPPAIMTFTPIDLAVEIDPSAVMRLTFSEPIDPASVVLEIRDVFGAIVPAQITTGLDDKLLVSTPNRFLNVNATYEARLVSVTDRAGNPPLGLPVIHRFNTLDTIGPTISDLNVAADVGVLTANALVPFVASFSPPEIGPQVQATLDLQSFSLSPPDGPVMVRLGQAGTQLIRARGIDRAGNFGPWFEKTLVVQQNLPPTVAITKVRPVNDPILSGQDFEIRFEAADDGAVQHVQARIEGPITLEDNADSSSVLIEGRLDAELGPGFELRASIVAEDNSGSVTVSSTTFPIEDGVAPNIVLSTGGITRVNPGDTVHVTVTASDRFGLTELRANVNGPVTAAYGGTLPSPVAEEQLTFDVSIPSNASGELFVVVTARDARNERTAFRQIPISDVVPPEVTSVVPEDGATNVPLTATVFVYFSEPVTNVRSTTLYLLANGSVIPARIGIADGSRWVGIDPLDLLPPLTTVQIVIADGITDLAGLALPASTTSFTTEDADLLGPRLVAFRPPQESTNVPFDQRFEYEFDEVLLSSSISPSDFAIERMVDGAILPVSGYAVIDQRTLRFTPPRGALRPSTEYRATLARGPRDLSGNEARDLYGDPWTQLETTFTTARIDLETWVGAYETDQRVVEGHAASLRVDAESNARLLSALFAIEGRLLEQSHPFRATFAVPDSETTLTATATALTETGSFELGPLVITIEPRGEDYDSDGYSNDAEASGGTNPFVDDVADDPDQDNFTNAQELDTGTDPHRADTDNDGIVDGADLEPLSGNRPPGIGVWNPPQSQTGLYFFGSGNEGLELPASLAIDYPMTLELWAYETSASGPILGSATSTRAINIAREVDGRISVVVRTEGSVPVKRIAPGTTVRGHIAVTYDGQRVRLFLNGRLVLQAPQTGALDHSAGPLKVSDGYTGLIDELRVWSHARSGSSIAGYLHRGLEGEVGGLVASYRFESADLGFDATGHGHAATVRSPITTFGAEAYLDRSFLLSGASFPFFVGGVDLDNDWSFLVFARVPEHGRLYRSDGAEIAVQDSINPADLTYIVDPGYFGTDHVEIHTEDPGSVPLLISFTTPNLKTWTGVSEVNPTSWSEPTNWTPEGVPTAQDQVLIPPGMLAELHESTGIAGLYVSAGAILMIETSTTVLVVSGHASAEGTVDGAGFVELSGAASTARGSFSNVRISSDVRLGGSMSISGDLEIVSPGILTMSGHTATVAGSLAVTDGNLVMTNAADLLEVEGDLTWQAYNYYNSTALRAGTMRLHGRFVLEDDSATTFVATEQHRVELVGNAPSIRMDWASTNANHFHHLFISSPNVLIEEPRTSFYPWLAVTGDFIVGSASMPVTVDCSGGMIELSGDLYIAPGSSLSAMSVYTERLGEIEGSLNVLTTMTIVNQGPTADLHISSGVSFEDLELNGSHRLSSSVHVPGNLSVSSLDISSYALSVDGNLTVGGQLIMTQPTAVVDVSGSVTFFVFSGSSPSVLSAGVLRAHGGIDVPWFGTTSFAASGDHRVELVGDTALIRMDRAGASTNHFRHLFISSPSASLANPSSFASPARHAYVSGNLTLRGTSSRVSRLTLASGQSLQIDGVLELQEYSAVINNAGTISFAACTRDPTATATGFGCP
jgi:hypothetical protein